MITDYIGGEGSAETPKNDYVIYGWPLILSVDIMFNISVKSNVPSIIFSSPRLCRRCFFPFWPLRSTTAQDTAKRLTMIERLILKLILLWLSLGIPLQKWKLTFFTCTGIKSKRGAILKCETYNSWSHGISWNSATQLENFSIVFWPSEPGL